MYLLLDGNNLCHRAYHAINRDGKTDVAPGEIASSVCASAARYQREMGSTNNQTIIGLDGEDGAGRRRAIFPGYKGGRGVRPHEAIIVEAMRLLEERLPKLGMHAVRVAGQEADDVLHTLAMQVYMDRESACIVSSDRDLLQCVRGSRNANGGNFVMVGRPPAKKGGESIVWTMEYFKSEYGFHPVRLADYKALVGDASDAIPGIAGIGPMRAASLLEKFKGGLDELYRDVTTITPPSIRNKLIAGEADARMFKSITTLIDVPGIEYREIVG